MAFFRILNRFTFILVILFVFCAQSSYALQDISFSLPKVMAGQSQEISVIGSTVNIKGITDQANTLTVNGRSVIIQKDGSFQDDVIIPLGDTEIVIKAVDPAGREKIYSKKITAKENHFFMVGLADGTLNFSKASDGQMWERDGKHFTNGFNPDGKLAYYAAGKIMGKFLIKSALDTDKATQEKLFTYIDPDKYYPIYGDDSTVVYDVNSQGKFYILFEWDKSGFTVGNFQTQIGEEDPAKIAKYNRTLYGGKVNLESTQKTVYGEPLTKASFFAAEANQHFGHNEFLATGGSLYYLRHRNIVEGSEQVRFDVRDKNSGTSLYSIHQAPFKDYQIKYDEGRIIFNNPVLSAASSDTIISPSILAGNPVYIVINYEYKDQEAFPVGIEEFGQRTGGLQFSQALNNNIRVGMTYIQEGQPQDNQVQYRVYSVDSSVKFGNFTKVGMEFAQSKSATSPLYVSYDGGNDWTAQAVDTTNGIKDKAVRLTVNSNLGEYFGHGREFMDLSGYYQYIGDNFVTSDTLYQAGTEKYGFEIGHRLTKDDKVRFIYEKDTLNTDKRVSENQVTAKSIQNFIGQWIHTCGKWGFITEYLSKDKVNSLAYIDGGQRVVHENSLAERITYEINKATSIYGGEQLTLRGTKPILRTSAGIKTDISKDTKANLEGAVDIEGSSVMATFTKNVDKETTTYTSYSLSDSAIDGRSSVTSFGSNSPIGPNAVLNTERQFVTNDIRGAYASNLMGINYKFSPQFTVDASYQRRDEKVDYNLINNVPRDVVSGNLSYVQPDKYKLDTMGEYRRDTNKTWQVLTDSTGEVKVFKDLFLFGEYQYSIAYRQQENDSYSKIDKKSAGLAYRPVDFDWFNALVKFIRFTDERPQGVTNADGGFLTMNSTSDTWAAECAIDTPCNIQFVEKFAYKNEKSLAFDPLAIIRTPDSQIAMLFIQRLNYHLTKKIDAAVEYRVLQQTFPTEKHREDGFLIEANYLIMKNIAIGAGYNFTSFRDNLNAERFTDLTNQKTARGFFIRMQGRY